MHLPIFLTPVFKQRIWGGSALNKYFGYEIPSERTGECWAVSAHPHGQSLVREGQLAGLTLGELWERHRSLFGYHSSDTFPLLSKILDANEDLSVQVHPDDEYAQKHGEERWGKTECWYILDCRDGAELIYGHTAQSKDELRRRIQQDEWEVLLRKKKIRPGDFIYVPSGTLHALGSGTLALEIQQNSDTTYCVYDYDRLDERGKSRALHIDKALDVINVPHVEPRTEVRTKRVRGAALTTFIRNEFFSIYKWEVDGKSLMHFTEDFLLVSVIEGRGRMISQEGVFLFVNGDHFILPHRFGPFRLVGKTKWILAAPASTNNKLNIYS